MTGPTDRPDPQVEPELSAELERYAKRGSALPPTDLADQVMAAIAAEPTPRRGLLAWLAMPGGGQPLLRLARAGMVTAALVLAVVGTLWAGQLAGVIRNGSDPSPSPSLSPAVTDTAEPSPTSTEPAVESESPDASAVAPSSVAPSASSGNGSPAASPSGSADDSGGASSSPSDSETPRPSQSATPSPTPSASPS